MDTRNSGCYNLSVKHRQNLFSTVAVFLITLSLALPALPQDSSRQANRNAPAASSNRREEAYRANNLGVALLEQFTPKPAVEKFRRALEIDPQLSIARVNLSIALFYAA